ncbi:MAG: hypothetical protein AAGA11_08815 [Pseudomonadota bacterium]
MSGDDVVRAPLQPLRCLVMPLSERFALLPSALVHALLYNERVSAPPLHAPAWVLGSVQRDGSGVVPLLSLERLCSLRTGSSDIGHIALIRRVDVGETPPFFAVRLAAAPWVVEVDSANVSRSAATDAGVGCVASHITLDGKAGVIPDLDAIGRHLSGLSDGAPAADA